MSEHHQDEKMVSDAGATVLRGGQQSVKFGCRQQVFAALVLVSRPDFLILLLGHGLRSLLKAAETL